MYSAHSNITHLSDNRLRVNASVVPVAFVARNRHHLWRNGGIGFDAVR